MKLAKMTVHVSGEEVSRDDMDIDVAQSMDGEPYMEIGFRLWPTADNSYGVRVNLTRDDVVELLQEMNRVEAFSLAWDAATDVLLDRGLIAEK
jgi:hypothetical protein